MTKKASQKPAILGIIPVRMESSRLPDKPLAMIGEKPLVIRVWEQARQAKIFSRLAVATDSQKIAESCSEFGAEVIMTSNKPRNGSERVHEALLKTGENWDIVFNVQGDMPFIVPQVIDQLGQHFITNLETSDMATLALPIKEQSEYLSSSCVKVVFDKNFRALYFSRSPIPNYRDGPETASPADILAYKHIGLYAFKPQALENLVNSDPSPLEKAESLEQLRALENGQSILVVCVNRESAGPSIEVDTPEDLERARLQIKNS